MNKLEIVVATARQTGETRNTVRSVLDAATGIITTSLLKEGDVFLYGLGKLTVKNKAKRVARNMKTGEPVMVPAHKTVGYRPSDNLKTLVNKRAR